MGLSLQPVEDAIRSVLIPALLEVEDSEVGNGFRKLLANSVKCGGMVLRDPSEGADALHETSRVATGILAEWLFQRSRLDLEAHQRRVKETGAKAQNQRREKDLIILGVMKEREGASRAEKKRLEGIGECGAWLTCSPNKLAGNLLSAEEWRDNARLRYGLKPKGLCERCNGVDCNAPFMVEHMLSCKKGGLVVQRHNNIAQEAGKLCALALTPSRVSYEPLIFHGTGVVAGQGSSGSEAS